MSNAETSRARPAQSRRPKVGVYRDNEFLSIASAAEDDEHVEAHRLCSACEAIRSWARENISKRPISRGFATGSFNYNDGSISRESADGCHLCTLMYQSFARLPDGRFPAEMPVDFSVVVQARNPDGWGWNGAMKLEGTGPCLVASPSGGWWFEYPWPNVWRDGNPLRLRPGPTMPPLLPANGSGSEASNSGENGGTNLESPPSQCFATSTGPQMAATMAKVWMRECIENHSKCLGRDSLISIMSRPSRLLAVSGNLGDPDEVRIVDSTSYNMQESYATLSYCWGGRGRYTLTTASKDQLHRGISTSSLPATIRDSIRVIRELGIKYLWVDSLCIIQDSPNDKARELPKMADIYRNSLLTIAALGASDAEEGLFCHRDPLVYTPCWLCRDSRGVDIYFYPHNWFDSKESLFWRCFDDAALHKRGWVVQERFLAPRTLNFGISLVWECRERLASEFGWEDMPFRHPGKSGGLCRKSQYSLALETAKAAKQQAQSQSMEEPVPNSSISRLIRSLCCVSFSSPRDPCRTPESELDTQWRQLVTAYSYCRLTLESDKIAAFEAILQHFRDLVGWQHYYGLSEAFLVEGLAWARIPYVKPPPVLIAHGAPTWSWASFSAPICYPFESRKDKPLRPLWKAGANKVELVSRSGSEDGAGDSSMLPAIEVTSVLLSVRRLKERNDHQEYTFGPEWDHEVRIMGLSHLLGAHHGVARDDVYEQYNTTGKALFLPLVVMPREDEPEVDVHGLKVFKSATEPRAYVRRGIIGCVVTKNWARRLEVVASQSAYLI